MAERNVESVGRNTYVHGGIGGYTVKIHTVLNLIGLVVGAKGLVVFSRFVATDRPQHWEVDGTECLDKGLVGLSIQLLFM